MSQKRGIGTAIACLLFYSQIASLIIISPTLAGLIQYYHDVPSTSVLLLASLPSLLAIPTSLAAGLWGGKRISFRVLALIATFTMGVSGVLPALLKASFTAVLICRGVYGLGFGIVFAIMGTLIMKLYEGPSQARMLGFGAASLAAVGVTLPLLAGVLTVTNVHFMWWVHGYAFVAFLAVLFWLPEPDSVPEATTKAATARVNGLGWGFILAYGISTVAAGAMLFGYSSVIVGEGLGNAAQAGLWTSIMFSGAFLAGLVFGPVSKFTGKYVLIITALVIAGAFAFLAVAQSLVLLWIGGFVFGVGFNGWLLPATFGALGRTQSPAALALAASLIAVITNVFQFLAPYFISFSSAALNNPSPRASWFVGAGVFAAAAVFYVLVRQKVAAATPVAAAAESAGE
ncbi:MAG: MFS transporter [Coriobacteriia bacterium]